MIQPILRVLILPLNSLVKSGVGLSNHHCIFLNHGQLSDDYQIMTDNLLQIESYAR